MRITLIAALLVSLAALPVGAQEGGACDSAGYARLADVIDVMVEDVRTGEADVLTALRQEIQHFEAQCLGLSFEGTAASVIGPVSIPEGIYRATATTEGFFIADFEVLDGQCDVGFMGLFNLTMGSATEGAETTVRSEGCTALIEVSNITQPWTLSFELIQ